MEKAAFKYPVTKRDDTIDKYGLADPYRWLEDPDSDETKKWVDAQNEVTRGYINQYKRQDEMKKRLETLFDHDTIYSAKFRGSKVIFQKRTGLQNQGVFYVQEGVDGKAEVLLDPNTMSEDGTASINYITPSKSGNLVIYGVHKGGSDWQTARIIDTNTKKNLDDVLDWIKFTNYTFTSDEKAIIYSKFPTPTTIDKEKAGKEVDVNKGMQLYYHKIGTPQDQDVMIFDPQDPDAFVYCNGIVEDKYLYLTINKGASSNYKIYILEIVDLAKGEFKVHKAIDNTDHSSSYAGHVGKTFYVRITKGADRFKVMSFEADNSAQENWKEVIPETKDTLQYAKVYRDKYIICLYLEHACNVAAIYDLEGKFIRNIPFPDFGDLSLDVPSDGGLISAMYVSLIKPPAIYFYDIDTNESKLFLQVEIKGVDFSQFECNREFAESADGTKLPIFICNKKGCPKDSSRSALVWAYGGFAISNTPYFSPNFFFQMRDMGGFYVHAVIRGGGEYGDNWHKCAIKENRQKCFDDFIAVSEYLVKNGYAKAEKLMWMGGSNGGLLVAACANQRPDLCGVVYNLVGVNDLLRYHLFTIGHAWKVEFGDPDTDDYKYILKWSPLHNIKKGKQYPAIMVSTADHDDRVVPLHSYKYAAMLQHELAEEEYQKNPLMILVDVNAGHGAGKPTSKKIQDIVERFSFACVALGIDMQDI